MKELIEIQNKLKAPKGRKNSFGNYNYRSCEDILEAVKPLLAEYECELTLTDDIVAVGERVYVKATATIHKSGEVDPTVVRPWESVTAYAREAETKKGMDDSQITGTASSYARKYALNGLFLIDDTKDADTDEYTKQTRKEETIIDIDKPITASKVKILKELATKYKQNISDICRTYKIDRLEDMTEGMYGQALTVFKGLEKDNG